MKGGSNMTIHAENLGYREIARLAEFLTEIAENGISGDCAEFFTYDIFTDCAYRETENGKTISSDDI